MEEKTTQKKYIWGWTLYKSMLWVMGVYGAARLIFVIVEQLLYQDVMLFKITWSIYLMCVMFVLSSVLGMYGIRKDRKNYKTVLIFSIISAVLSLFTTFKLIGYLGSSTTVESSVIVFFLWIVLGILPPFLLMGSVMQLTDKKRTCP